MFNSYQKLDPITWYVGARTEYNGLRLNQELLSKNTVNIKKDLKRCFAEHGVSHCTIEIETTDETCDDLSCCTTDKIDRK